MSASKSPMNCHWRNLSRNKDSSLNDWQLPENNIREMGNSIQKDSDFSGAYFFSHLDSSVDLPFRKVTERNWFSFLRVLLFWLRKRSYHPWIIIVQNQMILILSWIYILTPFHGDFGFRRDFETFSVKLGHSRLKRHLVGLGTIIQISVKMSNKTHACVGTYV